MVIIFYGVAITCFLLSAATIGREFLIHPSANAGGYLAVRLLMVAWVLGVAFLYRHRPVALRRWWIRGAAAAFLVSGLFILALNVLELAGRMYVDTFSDERPFESWIDGSVATLAGVLALLAAWKAVSTPAARADQPKPN